MPVCSPAAVCQAEIQDVITTAGNSLETVRRYSTSRIEKGYAQEKPDLEEQPDNAPAGIEDLLTVR